METDKEKQIDDLVNRIDLFMSQGGGRMNVTGGHGTPDEFSCVSCCGEDFDPPVKTPAK